MKQRIRNIVFIIFILVAIAFAWIYALNYAPCIAL